MNGSVLIRPYQSEDVADVTTAVRESVDYMSVWMPWCHPNYAEADAAAWVATTLEGHRTGTMFDFAIVDGAGCYVGGCGINRINDLDGVANLGYWVRATAAGRGIAPAAVLQLISWAFLNTPLHRLEIVVAVDNFRSQRVAEKVGAHRDAVLKKRILVRGQPSDAVLYSVLRPD